MHAATMTQDLQPASPDPEEIIRKALQVYRDTPLLHELDQFSEADQTRIAKMQEAELRAFLPHMEEALRARQFSRYVSCWKLEIRLQGFLAVEPLLTDEEYWPLLGTVWRLSGGVFGDEATWLPLLSSKRQHRELIMSEDERDFFAALPDRLVVYRASSHPSDHVGLSWTLDSAWAEFSANYANKGLQIPCGRFYGKPIILEGDCARADVLAYFAEPQEKEIVIDGRKVRGKRVIPRHAA